MEQVYSTGERWCIRFLDLDGVWQSREVAQTEGEARLILRALIRELDARRPAAAPEESPLRRPLRSFFAAWLAARNRRGLRSVRNDAIWLEHHIGPALGDLAIAEIRPRHVRELLDSCITRGLAPRSIRSVYFTLHKLYEDLILDEIPVENPCTLPKNLLPRVHDKDPSWRQGAIFHRSEVELLICSPMVPLDRQVLYGLLLLTGCRMGEIAALRWRDLDLQAEPLARLHVSWSYGGRTKTDTSRAIPVHPTLQALLQGWRAGGWGALTGRAPELDDLIIPNREGKMRRGSSVLQRFQEDLQRLGLRRRRIHDCRRTFITLARVDGAAKDILQKLTHPGQKDIVDLYTTLPWPSLCQAVSCLKVGRREVEAEAEWDGEQRQIRVSDQILLEVTPTTSGNDPQFRVLESWQKAQKRPQQLKRQAPGKIGESMGVIQKETPRSLRDQGVDRLVGDAGFERAPLTLSSSGEGLDPQLSPALDDHLGIRPSRLWAGRLASARSLLAASLTFALSTSGGSSTLDMVLAAVRAALGEIDQLLALVPESAAVPL